MPQKGQGHSQCLLVLSGRGLRPYELSALRLHGNPLYHPGRLDAQNALPRNQPGSGYPHSGTGGRHLVSVGSGEDPDSRGRQSDLQGFSSRTARSVATHHVIANCSPHLVFGKMLDKKAVTRADGAGYQQPQVCWSGLHPVFGSEPAPPRSWGSPATTTLSMIPPTPSSSMT